MLFKDLVIVVNRLMDVHTRVQKGGFSGAVVTDTELWRHWMGVASAGLRIVTTLSLGTSAVGSHTLLRGWVVILGVCRSVVLILIPTPVVRANY
jgi:hypothetical protein